MDSETSYGSSEYSAEAEELFAKYVLRRKAGDRVDFEALCAEHEALADELYGLHTDWDNVSSLLSRLEEGEPVGEVPGAEPEPAEPARAPSSSWKWVAGVGLVLAIGAGGVAFSLFRDKGVLAQEKRSLVVEKVGLLEERRQLEKQEAQLSRDLEAQRVEAESARDSARRASEVSAVLSARLGARALLEEESVLRAIDPEQLEAMEAWLARADALRMRVEALEPSDPILAADLELVEGDAGARERVEARLSLLRRVLAESTEQDERAWAEAIEEIADPARSPGYDGLVLDPHLALVPLGREPVSGLWVFADRRTGPVPERDGDGALILLLHPGSRDEGVPPFLIAASELLPSHLEYAGVGSEWSELGYLAPTPAQARLVGVLSRPILPAPVR